MAKIAKFLLCCAIGILIHGKAKAQLSGTYNVPTNYPTLAAALTALNTQSISGPVFIELTAGYAETAPSGGYSLTISGTSLNAITFRRTGVGADPVLKAFSGGSGTPSSAIQDGVWRFIGSDYITIDGIDILDGNTTNPSTMEFGIGFFRASASDGCQNNTVKNCVISLSTVNNATGSGPAVDGSRGINVVNSLYTTQTTGITPTSFSGTNSNNKFYTNTIKNCNVGIALISYAAASPFTLADDANDVGGSNSSTGNTILNFGGAAGATNPAAGIRTLAQYDLNISNNNFNNNNGSGANHVNSLRGIYVNTATSANLSINNNTISLNAAGAAVQTSGIENLAGATAANNTVSVTNNLIQNCTNTLNTTGSFCGIYNNGASPSNLVITNNHLTGINTLASTGSNYLIYNTGAVTNVITITNNQIDNCTNAASNSGAYYAIINNVSSTATLSISNNLLASNSTTASTGATQLIYNASSTSGNITLSTNTISNCTHSISSSGIFYGIFNNGTSAASLQMNSNSYLNHRVYASSGTTYLVYNTAAITNAIAMSNNTVSNCTSSISAGGSFYGVYNNAGSAMQLDMSNNTFSTNVHSATSGSIQLVFNRGAATNTFTGISMNNNLAAGCSYTSASGAPFLGVYNSGVTTGSLSLSNNTISTNSWAMASSPKYMVYNTGAVSTTLNLNNNLLSNCNSTLNTTGTFNGIVNAGSCTVALTICGNRFSNLNNASTTGSTYLMLNSGAVAGGVFSFTNNSVSGFTNNANGLSDFYGMSNSSTTFSTLDMSANTYSNNFISSTTGVISFVYNAGAVSTTISSISMNNNLITGNTSSVNSTGSFYGIYNNAASGAVLSMNSNTYTAHSCYATTGANHFIYNRGATTNTFSSVSMNNNLVTGCTFSASGAASFYNLWNNGVTTTLTSMSNNTITSSNWNTSTALRYLISNWSVAMTSANISGNLFSNCTHTINTTGFLYHIYNNASTAVSSGSLLINNNTFTNIASSASTGETDYINSSGATTNTFSSLTFTNNQILNCVSTITGSGAFYGLYNNSTSATSINLSQNTFSGSTLTSSTGAVCFIYNRGVAGNLFTAVTASNNLLSGITHSNSSNGTLYGILMQGAATTTCASLSVVSNTFMNSSSTGTSGGIMLVNTACPATASIGITNNLFSNFSNTLTSTGTFYAVNNGGGSAGNLIIANNTFTNLPSTASAANRYLIYNNGAITNSVSITNNLISACSHSISSTGSYYGIYNNTNSSGVSADLSSNTFTNNTSISTTGSTYLILNSGTTTFTIGNVTLINNLANNYTNVATTGPFYGFANSGFISNNLGINSNTLSNITTSATGSGQQLLYNSGKILTSITITNNLVNAYTNIVNTSGNFSGILNSVNYANSTVPLALSINNNSFLNSSITATSGTISWINNTGVTTNTITSSSINGNLFSNLNHTITGGGNLFGAYNTAISNNSLSINSNTFLNTVASTTSSSRYMIYNGSSIVNTADLSNNLVSGFSSTVNTSGSYYGINNGGNSLGDLNINNNTFLNHTLTASSGTAQLIYNSGIITNSVNITNNLISGITHSATAAGGLIGIYSAAGSSASLNIVANTFTNLTAYSASGPFYPIFNRAAVAGTVNVVTIANNLCSAGTFSSAGGSFAGIFNNGTNFNNLSISSNTFLNTVATTTSGARYFIYNTAAGSVSASIANNLFSGFTSIANTTGSFYGIINGGNQSGDLSIVNNAFLNHLLSASSGSAYAVYNTGVVNNAISMNNNLVSLFTHSASTSGGFQGFYNNAASSASLSISSNTVQNTSLYTSSGSINFMYNRGATSNTISTISISGNLITQITFSANSGPFYGIFNSATSFSNMNVSANSFANIVSTSSTSPRYFIINSGAGTGALNINSNTVSNYNTSQNTSGVFYDVVNTGSIGASLNIGFNAFNSQNLPSTTGSAYIINNTGAVTGSVLISSNQVSVLSHSSTTGILYGIYNSGPGGSISLNNNALNTINTSNLTSIKYLVYNTGNSGNDINLSNNTISSYSAAYNTTGNFSGIYNTGNCPGNFDASYNQLQNINVTATSATCIVINNTGTVSGASSLNNNLISGFTNSVSTSGTFYGIYDVISASQPSLTMNGNTFSNSAVNVPTVSIYLLSAKASTNGVLGALTMNNNTINSFTNTLGTGTLYGIYNNAIPCSSLSLNGNTFTNCVSSTTASPRYLVYSTGSVTGNISLQNNQIINFRSPLNTTADLFAVCNAATGTGNLNMNNNTVSNSFLESTTGNNFLVYNSANIANTINMNTNLVAGNTNSSTSSGNFYAVYNAGPTAGSLAMTGNSVTSNISNATSANTYLIYNSGVVSNSISLTSNVLEQDFANNVTYYSGTLYNIYNTGGASTTSLSVSNNTFLGSSYNGLAGSGTIYFIQNTNNNTRFDMNGNSWTGLSLNHNGSEYLMYNPSSTSVALNVLNNSVNGYTRTANAAALYLYYSNGSSPSTCTQLFSGNNFSNISAGNQGTGSFYGIYNMDGAGSTFPKKTALNNSIKNVNYNGLGFFYGYYFDLLGDDGSTGSSVYSNSLSAVSWGGPFYSLYIGTNISAAYAANVYSNSILNLSTSGTTADMYGAYLLGNGIGLNLYKNKISDLSSTGILGRANGIYVSNAANTSIYNNLIGNIFTPSTSALNPLNGINVSGGTKVNVYYNTVNLNATSTGTSFGSNALYASSSVSLDLRNNILMNTSAYTGNSITAAYYRSTSLLGNFASTSNNNNFYTGIPSANRLIFADGTNMYQTLPAYQAHVSPRDNASISENTPFLSTIGTSTNFLHVDPTLPSLTESGAANITGITDDVDGQIRQGNTGYVGSGTAPDIGADEYAQNLIPCSSANAGTVISPASPVNCNGQTIYLLSTGYTNAGNILLQWQVGTSAAGPFTNVAGGIGATTAAYTTPTLSAGNYYFVLTTTCTNGPLIATSNVFSVSINPGPSATASVLNPTICSGQEIDLTGTSTAIAYNWTGPDNFASTIQSPTITNAGTNASGTYTLLVSNANCTSSPVFVNVNVQPTPPAFTLTPPSSSICVGSSQTIAASLPISSPTLNFGNQTYQNSASGYPAPYSVYYGGQKMQMLILAGELAAAGFTTGTPIQSIQFPVVSLGANWNSSLFECQNFMVGIKATTVAALSLFELGLSNVVAPMNFTPTPGYSNVHAFSSPFIWDGSSNVVIETAFSNSIIGNAGGTVAQYNSPTGFQSTLVYRADNQNISTIAAATTSNASIGFVRPDFKLNGTQIGNYSWSPANGLSATSGVSVVASPSATTIYSVALSNGQCASTTTISVDVIQNPTLSIATTANTVCLGNSATLTASGATSYTWSTNSTQTNVVVAPFTPTTYTLTGTNIACPPASTTIFISSAAALSLTTNVVPAIVCQGGAATLNVAGGSTYTWTGGANTTSLVVSPSVTTSYTVSAYNGPGCWTSKIVNVKVNPLPVITVTPATATICLGESATFEASGVFNFTWTPGGSNSPIFTTNPVSSTSFTVLGVDQNNCANTASVDIIVLACTGISTLSGPTKAMSLFPNPTSGLATLQFGFEGEKYIHIENTVGAILSELQTSTSTSNIDLSAYAKGVYFIKVKSTQQSATFKLIVE